MRLWSIHPKYLDVKGFVGLWREALLAQRVLRGETKVYSHHPQLRRFQEQPDPAAAIAVYLEIIYAESLVRGYHFSRWRIQDADTTSSARPAQPIAVTTGQLQYELEHLKRKLAIRAPARLAALPETNPEPHPLFYEVEGGVEPWEKVHPLS